MNDRPAYRATLDRRTAPPPALPGPDELDRTARQVRLDYEGATVHRLAASWPAPSSWVVYETVCGEMFSRAEGAILTTREAGCHGCQEGGRRA